MFEKWTHVIPGSKSCGHSSAAYLASQRVKPHYLLSHWTWKVNILYYKVNVTWSDQTKLCCIGLFYYSYIISNIEFLKKRIVDIRHRLGHGNAFYIDTSFVVKASYLSEKEFSLSSLYLQRARWFQSNVHVHLCCCCCWWWWYVVSVAVSVYSSLWAKEYGKIDEIWVCSD